MKLRKTKIAVTGKKNFTVCLNIYDSAIKDQTLPDAIRKAVKYYTQRTSRGKAELLLRDKQFNWRHLETIPNHICRMFGFSLTEETASATKNIPVSMTVNENDTLL